jgi:hypothetical protein
MNLHHYDFEHLNAVSAGRGFTTFAYWLGVLTDSPAYLRCRADDACAAMSYQYDLEEQAWKFDDLLNFRDIFPFDFEPVAPVTLALHWSPFPAAIAALGAPVYVDRGKYGKVLTLFRPLRPPTFRATTDDERHFQFLLSHGYERAIRVNGLIMLTGSPGWTYSSPDLIANNPRLQQLLGEFGFVFRARKPTPANTMQK